jgi:pyruvate,water dikinase
MIIKPPEKVAEEDVVFKTEGQILGNSTVMALDWIIYIPPSEYSTLSQSDRYAVARIIGKLTHLEQKTPEKIMLLGPGRWGTTTPSLGVPVTFAEINTVSVLCEIAAMHEGLVPEISLGTHFFNDLVEMDMLYLGILPKRKNIILNETTLQKAPNLLEELLPEERKWANTIRVIQSIDHRKSKQMHLYVDALKQEALCYVGKK